MIMKLNVSNELKSRLMHAAENGSVIAKEGSKVTQKPVKELGMPIGGGRTAVRAVKKMPEYMECKIIEM